MIQTQNTIQLQSMEQIAAAAFARSPIVVSAFVRSPKAPRPAEETARLSPFYAWIGAQCVVSSRVSSNVAVLWQSYRTFCRQTDVAAERFALIQAVATEFPILNGLAVGVCLAKDATAFVKAWPQLWQQRSLQAHSARRR